MATGANVVLVPGAPTNLANNPSVTLASRIGLVWEDNASSGGQPILDHKVFFDQSTNNWVLLEEDVIGNSYVTTVPLIKGRSYSFKVQARNSVGLSQESNEVTIKAAEVPAKPLAPSTWIDG